MYSWLHAGLRSRPILSGLRSDVVSSRRIGRRRVVDRVRRGPPLPGCARAGRAGIRVQGSELDGNGENADLQALWRCSKFQSSARVGVSCVARLFGKRAGPRPCPEDTAYFFHLCVGWGTSRGSAGIEYCPTKIIVEVQIHVSDDTLRTKFPLQWFSCSYSSKGSSDILRPKYTDTLSFDNTTSA